MTPAMRHALRLWWRYECAYQRLVPRGDEAPAQHWEAVNRLDDALLAAEIALPDRELHELTRIQARVQGRMGWEP